MSTHNKCFHAEIRKISKCFDGKEFLSGAMFIRIINDTGCIALDKMLFSYQKY